MENKTSQLYPLSSQSFEEIREKGLLYIDKTDIIYNLVHPPFGYIFLSRPTGFGKSLLTSTLKSYFEGRRDLFKGLKIEKLEKEWTKYPVIYFDMSDTKEYDENQLRASIDEKLQKYEQIYGRSEYDSMYTFRMQTIIEEAYEKTGKEVVVLINDYYAPIINALYKENFNGILNALQDLYCPLKSLSGYIRFVFITDVPKYHSGDFHQFNNIKDISNLEPYASICGITEEEILTYLKPQVESLAKKKNLTLKETLNEIKYRYGGYHFELPSSEMINTYSLLNALSKEEFTASLLEEIPKPVTRTLLKFNTSPENIGGIRASSNDLYRPAESFKYSSPLLYQEGYLTIKDTVKYPNDWITRYYVDFPSNFVKQNLFQSLFSEYIILDGKEKQLEEKVFTLFNAGNLEDSLKAIQTYINEATFRKDDYKEKYSKSIFFLILYFSHLDIKREEWSYFHCRDFVVRTLNTIYLFVLTNGESATNALKQIEEKRYAQKEEYQGYKIVKVGIKFDAKEHNMANWKIKR